MNAYLEGGYDRSESTTVGYFYYGARPIILKAANNPFGKDIYVNFPASVTGNAESKAVNEGTRIAGGFTYDAFSDWVLAGDYSWSKTEINSIYPRGYGVGPGMGDIGIAEAANSGKLNVLRDTTSFFTNTLQFAGYVPTVTKQTMQDYSLRGNGTLFNWYAGSAKLATGLEYRTIESDGIAEWLGAAASHREQNTSAIYAEFSLPLISPDLNIPFAKSLEMQVAGRHERFDVKTAGTKLSKTTPTIGFKFSPTDWMVLRASYAEGFIPPSVSQISSPTPNASPTEITDPLRGNEKYTVQTVGGGNPDLTPETAKSTTLGLILTPSSIPNLRLSFDYYKIEKENNITSLNAQQILNDGSIYASRVTRAAAEAGDSYGVGKVTSIYTAPINALWLETSGLDSTVSYDLDSDYGRFNFNLGYTRVFDFTWQQALNAPANENLNIPSRSQAPLIHRGGASVFWQATDLLGVGWNSQYYGSYSLDVKGNPTLALEQGSDKVKHQIYHDVFARTTLFPSLVKKAHLDNAELTFGIKNLFDTKVIDMSNSNNYFSTFADPIGRQYYLNLKFNF
ncbi:TonB-dependent receptor (plasmid) [Acinetobacter soli]|nr:TonB-dependent receptor [Acinetobacter soli]WEI02351.1 TonB-dependent receptor [Acinetobacter soli]